jgi:hypothetical protein
VKKFLSIILSVCLCMMVFCVSPSTHVTAVGINGMTGSGTVTDPYIITTAEQLKNLASSGLDKCYKLGCSIDCSSYHFAWIPIDFNGTFDGNGYSVSGISMGQEYGYLSSYYYYNGLFRVLTNATIKNLHVSGSIAAEGYLGMLAGNIINSTITNCSTSGQLISDGCAGMGGLVGMMTSSTISDCSSTVTTTNSPMSSQNVAGFVGINYSSTITNCYCATSCDGIENVGGFVGTNYGTITNCHSSGTVKVYGGTYNDASGGFVGYNLGTIKDCYSECVVHGCNRTGGFAGISIGLIDSCYATGDVDGQGSVAGFVGALDLSPADYRETSEPYKVINCYSTGNVSDTAGWGAGFVGIVAEDADCINCYCTGSVTDKSTIPQIGYIGGFGGVIEGTVYNCYTVSTLSSNCKTYYPNAFIGGFAGACSYCVVDYSYWDYDNYTIMTTMESGASPSDCLAYSKHTAEMKDKSFATLLNSNISAHSLSGCKSWWQSPSLNNGYPVISGVGAGKDTTPPTGSYGLSKSTWTCNPVTITVSATDEGSGVASITTPGGAVVTNSTVTYTVSENGTYNFTLIDNAGNSGIYPVAVSNIDKTISVTHSLTVEYTIDPNADTLTGGEIPITNDSQHIGVSVTVQSFTTTGIANVAPDKYANWRALTTAQTAGSISLGLKVKEASSSAGGWNKISQTSTFYSASPENPVQLGIINVGGTGNLSLCAKYGLAWADQTSVQHNLTLVFNCADVD